MSIRTKYLTALAAWISLGFPLFILAAEVSQWFLLPFFALFVAAGGITLWLRCPKCRKPIGLNPIGPSSWGVFAWTPWVPRTCSRCQQALDLPTST